MKLDFNKKPNISFGDRVSNTKLFECCANCKYYEKNSVKKVCTYFNKSVDDNYRCTSHKQR